MRHDYSLLFSVAALGLVFSRQQAPASIVSAGLSKADVVPSGQAVGGERGGRMSTATVPREKRERN